ncbi:cytosol aminopeptidase [Candidatus Gastranaerophilus sp. (ex Termes propinquus)]|nr:cytosol aminopeptidase [Candidatus Gastranaerophilus sp. (ex Termes propinquus)]
MATTIKITAGFQEVAEIKSDMLVLGLFEDDKKLNTLQKKVNEASGNIISDYVLKKEGFEPKFGESYVLQTFGKIGADKILFIGLGKKEEFTPDKLREVSAKAYKICSGTLNVKRVSMEIFSEPKSAVCHEATRAMYEGLCAGAYSFDKYKSKKKPQKINSIEILPSAQALEKDCQKAIEVSKVVCSALDFTKDLVNEPSDYATPTKIATMAQDFTKELPELEVHIYGKDELEKMGFGAFLAVSKGSAEEPKFVHVKYCPKSPKRKVAIIGKGITFDSGGLNIKPPASMMNMKTDMAGCACVLGTIRAVAQLKPDVEVHALAAVCENMPGERAYKLGDVLVAKNGKTIELDNTDAEGRLTLADVLCYADELGVDEIVDVATLTGACVVALGNNISGIMGKNQRMVDKIIETGKRAGENLWQLPLMSDMQESLKSEVADMRNTGGRGAGSSVAGIFLSNFVKNKNWAHLDIAGTAFAEKPYRELQKGATGTMVKTLIRYICE